MLSLGGFKGGLPPLCYVMDKEYIVKEFGEILLDIDVELGRKKVAISELLRWEPDLIIKLDKTSGESIDVLVNNKPIAYAEIIVLDEKFAIRITDIYSDEALVEKNKDGLYDW
jgi:flagellar motor switch protein FliN/FliY